MAQWLSRLTYKRKDVGSNPTVGKNFSFYNSRCFAFLATELSQYKYYVPLCFAGDTKINHDILANSLFWLGYDYDITLYMSTWALRTRKQLRRFLKFELFMLQFVIL